MAGTVTNDTDVMKLAFGHLKLVALLASNDLSPEAQAMRTTYRPTVDGVIYKHNWNCCIMRTTLAPIGGAEAAEMRETTDWQYLYKLPEDYLRLMPPGRKGGFETRPIPHQVEGDRVLTNEPPPFRIRYLGRKPEVYWSPPLVEVVALTLAVNNAHLIAQKTTLLQELKASLKDAWMQAKASEGQEGSQERPLADSYELARHGITVEDFGITYRGE